MLKLHTCELYYSNQYRVDVVKFIDYLAFRMYSNIDDVDDAWAQLVSLKVFKPTSTKSTLDLIDIRTASPDFAKSTKIFSHANEFEHYLNQSLIEGGTRFM